MSFFQAQAIGNLGRDPEMSYTPDGTAVTRFSIAVNKKSKDKEETIWLNCVAFRKNAETLNTYLRKGDQVFVQGDLSVRQYATREGRNGISIDLLVDRFTFVGSKKSINDTLSAVGSAVADPDPLGELDEHPF